MADLVRCETESGLAWVTLNRPEVRNALSFDALAQLGEIVETLQADQGIRVVLLTGEGDKAFSAGADLKERGGFSDDQTTAFVERIGDTFTAVAALPQPTIAVLNGGAFGGGLELALSCDLRVAAEGIQMGLTETSLAIIPAAGGTQRLTALIGPARAKEMIFTARRIDTEEALAIGLVNDVAPADELRARASDLAGAIAKNGPLAVRAAKAAIDLDQGCTPMSDRLARERALYFEGIMPSKDRLEALEAFREKRPPEFQGE
ncbi:MAG: enoyl-CoA hydratase-related protein [Planctomycetota bacterium]|nr:enoyl-CoA hydratase-related protein [Planctomycetota bacterium]